MLFAKNRAQRTLLHTIQFQFICLKAFDISSGVGSLTLLGAELPLMATFVIDPIV